MPSVPTSRSPSRSGAPDGAARGQPQPAQVAVRLAAEVQPRDRLLADVAALLERDRAVVETGLLRDHGVVEVGAVARPAALDPADLVRGLRRGHGAGARSARRRRARPPPRRTGRRRRGRSRSAARSPRRRSPRGGRARARAAPPRPRRAAPAGPTSDSSPVSSVRLCSSTSRPSLKRRIMLNSSCSAHALGVEQQLVAGVEDPQVAEHLPLVGQEGRVAALAGHERLDVVRHLAVEELLRLAAASARACRARSDRRSRSPPPSRRERRRTCR